MTSLKWAPFAKPPPDSNLVSPQLIQLIARIQSGTAGEGDDYLGALWNTINQAIVTMPFPPSQYSGYANAIVGKPLALVNAGWSLELAQAPSLAQHTGGPRPGGPKQVVTDPKQKPDPNADKFPTEQQMMDSYH